MTKSSLRKEARGKARLVDTTREKVRELGHRETLIQPNAFLLQKKLRELELRQQRSEEMLSAIFLAVEEIRDAVGAGDREPGGAGFRLPDPCLEAPPLAMPWWKRALLSFFQPQRLRRPGANRW